MKTPIEILQKAQEHAFKIRPASGGFPVLAEVLRQYGVNINRWLLPSCQAIYLMNSGNVIQQGSPIALGTIEIPTFNLNNLILAIRKDQKGESSFPDFLKATWEAGVIEYIVDFKARNVVYYGCNGEKYTEEYPSVEVKL